jgi:hypothetical protein
VLILKAVLVEQVLHHLYQEHKFNILVAAVAAVTRVALLFL